MLRLKGILIRASQLVTRLEENYAPDIETLFGKETEMDVSTISQG